MLRVVVGEDSYIAREGICRILEAEQDIEIVATCGELATLRYSVGEQQPDVVVADLQMPPTHTDEGIRLATELRRTHPRIGVVILSQHAEPLYATQLLAEGSDRRAYLLTERVLHRGDLIRAVREVAEGQSVSPHSLHLLQARPRRLGALQPPCQGGSAVCRGRGDGPLDR